MAVTISQLIIYPVKSLAGISLQKSRLDAMGLQFDRRWMIVSSDHRFITQRTHPQMALIQTELQQRGNQRQLVLKKNGMADLVVPIGTEESKLMPVTVWDDTVNARHCGTDYDAWLSEAIGEPCQLVFIPDDEIRQCDLDYARQGERTGFADGFPMLLISEASLDDLNHRLQRRSSKPLEMRRFRPNLVVSGCDAYAEDQWRHFQIGNINLRGVKPCSRCVMTTVDPLLGERSGNEPLATLNTYRKQGNKVLFGMNVVHEQSGELALGDVIDVIDVIENRIEN